jgi:hypothetical protein
VIICQVYHPSLALGHHRKMNARQINLMALEVLSGDKIPKKALTTGQI